MSFYHRDDFNRQLSNKTAVPRFGNERGAVQTVELEIVHAMHHHGRNLRFVNNFRHHQNSQPRRVWLPLHLPSHRDHSRIATARLHSPETTTLLPPPLWVGALPAAALAALRLLPSCREPPARHGRFAIAHPLGMIVMASQMKGLEGLWPTLGRNRAGSYGGSARNNGRGADPARRLGGLTAAC
jgi:hypothetical protein